MNNYMGLALIIDHKQMAVELLYRPTKTVIKLSLCEATDIQTP